MATKRIKDLATASPVDAAHFVALDDATGGTKKATITALVAAGVVALGFSDAKANLSASVDPTVADDSSAGYKVGSLWVVGSTRHVYICFDATVGAAQWRNVLTPENLTTHQIVLLLNTLAEDISFNNGGKLTDVLAGTDAGDVVIKSQLDGVASTAASATSAETASRIAADSAIAFPPPVSQASSTRTLSDADNGKTIFVTYAGLCVITVPQNLTPGFSCSVQNVDPSAQTEWVASGTQNVWGPSGLTKNTVQYATSGVVVRSSTHAALLGALDS